MVLVSFHYLLPDSLDEELKKNKELIEQLETQMSRDIFYEADVVSNTFDFLPFPLS
jgi:hypothetical protein